MKPRHLRLSIPATLITVACSILATDFVSAASQTWDGDTDANWGTGANWVAGSAPGIIYTANNTNTGDVATFNTALNATTLSGSSTNPIITETNRMIGRISFDTATAGSYFIGASVTPPTLTFGNNLTIVDVTSTVVNSQTINAPVALHLPSSTNGAFTIQNNSTAAATLTLAGGILNSPNSTRGTLATLRGSNTGENIVSGTITLTNTGGVTSSLTKADAGTWVLSGANAFASGGGVVVTGGVLAAANNAALGVNASANTQNASVTGGVLEIRNGITIDNGVSMNLSNGGTVRGVGTSATLGRINVGTAAATAVTLSTVSSGDVFSIGNASNEFTGGAADTVVHIAGPGTISQAQASNYAGTWAVDAGTLSLGAATSLGTLGSVNVAPGAKLQTQASSPTLTVLTGAGVVSNGAAGSSVLTANIATTDTFAGQLQDGSPGTLGLTKTGAGILTLSGASTYSDPTVIGTGTLNLTGSLGNTAVSGSTGATLSGNGTITGGVTVDANVHLAPGDGGNAALGTLTVGALTLNTDAQLDLGITNTTTLDKVSVTSSGGLVINGGQVNINGGTSAFTTNGTYPIMTYSGALTGSVSSLSVNGLNKSVTKTYTFTASAGVVNLVVANSGVAQTFWNVNADGNWSTNANWTPATAPNTTGAFAGFGGGGTEITANRTVTVNGSFTVGTLALNGAANGKSYTFAAGTGANLTLNNGASGAFVTDTSGSHTISSPLTLTGNGATFTVSNAADTLSVNGVISGGGNPLVKGGPGTLALSGVNTHTSGTTINGGTLLINSAESLGDPANTTSINAGTLRNSADLTISQALTLGDTSSAFSVAPATTLTIDGAIANGGNTGTLNKSDTGTLVLTASNSYSGGSIINAGTVLINNPNSLGDSGGALTLNNATLEVTTGFTSTRNINLGSATSVVSVDPGQTYTISGPIGGTGTLNKTGSGTLSIGSTSNSYTGGTVINAGILAVNINSFLGSGTVTFQGGTLQNNYGANTGYFFGNPISVPAGQTGTINMNNRMSLGSGAPVTGSGTLNVNLNTTVSRDDFNNSWTGFTGQVNFAGTGTGRLVNNSGTFDVNSFANCAVDVGGSAFLQPVTNSGAGNTYAIGALSGSSATAGLAGATAGPANFSVGALNTSTTFAGQINGNDALTKVGSGTLTLSGINSYTGNTTINAGEVILATGAQLKFAPGVNGVSNKITGIGTATLNGAFNIDTTAANITNGNSWILVDVSTVIETYGGSFTVSGYTQSGTTWTKLDGGNTWKFDQTTGVLTLTTAAGYATWTSDPANGLTAGVNDGATQDPDGDGIPNLMEYVLGGIPAGAGAANTSILPTQTLDATDLTLTFHRSDFSESDTTLKAQWSSDLVTWNDFSTIGAVDALPAVHVTEDSPSAGVDTVVVKIPRSGHEVSGKLFGRLQAVK